MFAIECSFYHATIGAANTQRATWTGKPGFLGGYTRTGVANSPNVADMAIGYWAVNGPLPAIVHLPQFCRLVELSTSSLNFVLGIL